MSREKIQSAKSAKMPPHGALLRPLRAVKGLPQGALLRALHGSQTTNDAGPIGSMDAKSGRLVLQAPKNAKSIAKQAAEEHDEAKRAIVAAIQGVAGARLSGDRDEKDPERVQEKVDEGQKPQTVRDYSGFRIAVDTPEAWKQTAAALRGAFEVPDEQDQFEKGSEENFHGHTVQVRMPGSAVTHEVQILPREVAETVDDDHDLYEKARDGDAEALRELKDANRGRYIDFLERNGQEDENAKPSAQQARLEAMRAALSSRAGSAAKPEAWKKGDWFVAPNPQGGFDAGVVRYWNPGYNGKKNGVGRVEMKDGRLRSERPPVGAMKVQARPEMLQPMTGGDGEAAILKTHGPKLAEHAAKYLAEHTRDGATWLATDAAQAMLPEFQSDPAKMDRDTKAMGAAIHEAALATSLTLPVVPERRAALIEVGTPASGKTTGMMLGGDRAGVGLRLEAIPEHMDKLDGIVEALQSAGWEPMLEWVHAGKPETTVQRMIDRAMGSGERPGLGRTVPVRYMAGAWEKLPKAVAGAKRHYGQRLPMVTVDNSGAPGEETVGEGIKSGMEPLEEAAAHRRMLAELDRLEQAGRFQGPEGAAVLAAAKEDSAALPQKQINLEKEENGRQRAMGKMRAAAPESAKTGMLRDESAAAWQRAGETLRGDPSAQVPF